MPVDTFPDPVTLDNPSVMIGTVPTEFICAARSVALTPTDKEADIATFCDPAGTRPSTTTWVAAMELILSYGAAGSWNLLRAMAKTKQTFVIMPEAGTASASNPSATFEAWIPSIPFVDGKIGEATIFTLTCKVKGEPVFDVTP